MFNVGGPEVLVIILVALLVLGPEQLPKAMRTFGNAMAEIRKVSNGFQSEMRAAMHAAEADAKPTEGGAGATSSSPSLSGLQTSPPSESETPSSRSEQPSSHDSNANGSSDGSSSSSAADRAAG